MLCFSGILIICQQSSLQMTAFRTFPYALLTTNHLKIVRSPFMSSIFWIETITGGKRLERVDVLAVLSLGCS